MYKLTGDNKSIEIKVRRSQFKYKIIFNSFLSYIKRSNIINKLNVSKIVIITDSNVKLIYAAQLRSELSAFLIADKLANSIPIYDVDLIEFNAGEESKNLATKEHIENEMLRKGYDRNCLILAIGGGVVGDLAGFIASTYMRGVNYIQIPTTLLAMVDSSIGGKTGINTSYGKNLIGSFWQPKAVIVDVAYIRTLPDHHYINGLFEIIKIFITNDNENFTFMNNHIESILQRDEKTIAKIIKRAIFIKSKIVECDEKENGMRALLNFGHTIGHAIEHLSGYGINHGYAVGIGILVESKISVILNKLDKNNYKLIRSILSKLNINLSLELIKKISHEKIIAQTKHDKKNKNNANNDIATIEASYVLIKKIGEIYIEKNNISHKIRDCIVKQALLEIESEN